LKQYYRKEEKIPNRTCEWGFLKTRSTVTRATSKYLDDEDSYYKES
jgi:hypothetical protein